MFRERPNYSCFHSMLTDNSRRKRHNALTDEETRMAKPHDNSSSINLYNKCLLKLVNSDIKTWFHQTS
ncbi:hypothetical protein Sjap_001753 [Stephania japonica]|uniref:Uncharacterized protein n=1 Tax=Stephania japonica TaxID=461633 RepID=A0AAP0KKJ3_9MAGN